MTEQQPMVARDQDEPWREQLPRLLSRLATLQGHAVPWHRFAMVSQASGGAPLDHLEPLELACELWRSRFPAGNIQLIDGPLPPSLAPALWVSAGQGPASVYLVRGTLSSGALSCVDAAGQVVDIPAERAAKGRVVSLRPDVAATANADGREASAHGGDAPAKPGRSASEWFRFAIRKRWSVFLECAVATITLNFVALATSFYSMQVYDRVVPTGGYSTLWVLTIGVAIAMCVELAMRQVRGRMLDRACKAIDEELSGVFFGHALAIRMDRRPRTVGTFAAQIRHFEMVRNFMTSTTLFVFADAPFALLFVGVIGFIAGPVALVPLAFIPLSVMVGVMFKRRLARLTEVHMEESNRKNGLLIEAVDGIESIKAAGADWKMLDRWQQLTRTLARDEMAIRDLTSLSGNLTQTLQQLCYVALVAAGAFAIGAGHLTVGGLIACTIISGRALSPIGQVVSLFVQWQQASTALRGLDAIMALPADSAIGERRTVPDACHGRLAVDGAAFSYGPDQVSLQVGALQFAPGDRVAVLGAVGSGKSTLIKLLSGLYRPSSGRVLLDGMDMAHLAPDFVREHVGYLPQDVRLFQGTLRENLALGLPSPSDDQILAAARQTGLDRVIGAHPKGLGIEISEGGRGLSGGQRQLVGLTRLVLARPRVMLLDEPTASMDPQMEELIAAQVFGARPADTTLVVVTHKFSMLRHFNRIVVVDRGRVVADGPRDEVLRRLREPAPAAAATSAAASASAAAAAAANRPVAPVRAEPKPVAP